MSCIPLPNAALPTLPFPIKLGPLPLPAVDFNAELCCKIALHLALPPIPFALIIDPVVVKVIVASMQAYIDQANTYINSLPLSCPLE